MKGDVLKLRGGSTAANNAFTGSDGELSVDAEEKRLRVHDGGTPGGYPTAKAAEVPTKTSDLDNDAYETKSSLSKLSQLSDDIGLWKKSELTKVSQLTNDAGYLTRHCSYCSYCSYCTNCS